MLATPNMVMLLNDQLNEARAERDTLFASRRQVLDTLAAVQNALTQMEAAMAAQSSFIGTLLSKLDEATIDNLPPDMKAMALRLRTVH